MTTEDARTQVDPLATPRTVQLVRRFEASRSRVFRPLSDPEEMVRWFAEEVRRLARRRDADGPRLPGHAVLVGHGDDGERPPGRVSLALAAGRQLRRRRSGSSSSRLATAPSSRSPTAPSTCASRVCWTPTPRRTRAGERHSPGSGAGWTSPWSCARGASTMPTAAGGCAGAPAAAPRPPAPAATRGARTR